jgi:hypothetical protein
MQYKANQLKAQAEQLPGAFPGYTQTMSGLHMVLLATALLSVTLTQVSG